MEGWIKYIVPTNNKLIIQVGKNNFWEIKSTQFGTKSFLFVCLFVLAVGMLAKFNEEDIPDRSGRHLRKELTTYIMILTLKFLSHDSKYARRMENNSRNNQVIQIFKQFFFSPFPYYLEEFGKILFSFYVHQAREVF